mgnify:CR=1 FL=1|nr:Asp-tRNA(Asn)/Glu-tRNA(Gln) amidotransferase subunit GatC [uncultured Cellulosilyticum sp.]
MKKVLDTALITYLADLSKLGVDEAEKEKFVTEMSAIVELMDTINEVEMNEEDSLNRQVVGLEQLREDQSIASYNTEVILQNASHKKDGFFVVPKIME